MFLSSMLRRLDDDCTYELSLAVAGVIGMPQNFYPNITSVLINGSACTNVVVNVVTLASLTCVAPMGAGTVIVYVIVDALSGSIQFAYDAPVLHRISASPRDAASTSTLTVRCLRMPASPQLRCCGFIAFKRRVVAAAC